MPSSALQMGSAASTSTRGAVHMTQPWLTRRSVAKYDVEKAIPEAAITGALEAATLAPNHFLNEPWRFYQAGPDTIAKLCALNEEKAKMFAGVPKWMTGALGVAPEAVMGVVGADTEAERFMGAIWYGYPAKDLAEAKAPKRKLGMEMHTKLA